VSQPISPTPLPDEQIVTDDLDLLLDALPPRIVESLRAEERRTDLLEVVMDLGRLPEARYPGREVILSREEVTEDDLQFVTDRIGDFGGDNRAGIERTLHRISCIRNRRGKVVGLTCRVGRAVYGTIRVIEDLVISGKSILLLGKPGVGKTTMLREVARVLADDANKRVIIVDTSNEIGGDGDVPHPAIGGSRRMQVATPLAQHAVMIEAVENHMPEVIVIDEIGTELEAQAARTIAERGVQLVGTAHGTSLENLMLNPTLADLIGGIQSVTLGDEEARRRGTQKSILERKAPPTFDVVIEIESWQRVAIHKNVAETVDAMLRGYEARPETRQLGGGGRIQIVDEPVREEGRMGAGAQQAVRPSRPAWEIGHRRNGGHVRDHRDSYLFEQAPAGAAPAPPTGALGRVLHLFPFGIPRSRLENAIRSAGVAVQVVDELSQADVVLTMRSYYRSKPAALREAEERNIPMYVVKSNSTFQLEQVLLQFRGDGDGDGSARGARRDPMVDVFRETEDAIAKVIEEGRPIELPPANSYVRRVQHQLATRYNLDSSSSGKEPLRRVKILPLGPGAGLGR
jgi:stage III sporulation protein SpoIIIAA